MNPSIRPLIFLLLVVVLSVRSQAETVKDREGAVRGDKARMEKDARWIYNDFERGFEESKKTGKPLLVVLRCVPCIACMGIDASVLTEPELDPLLHQFVCVRLINANNLDLNRFQFDYDLSFSALLFNGDGTVYGRYGSWTHQKNAQDKTVAGFQAALRTVLEIHRDYPANKATLAGKQGHPLPFKTPLEIPTIAGKYERELDWKGKVVQSCVHCHQIGDAHRASLRDAGKTIPSELIYPQPMPETIGLTLKPDQAARVDGVVPGSAADKAGFKPGDEILALDGQPLISIADMSWVLHQTAEQAILNAEVRGIEGSKRGLVMTLEKGWRQKSDISRRVATWGMRAMAFGGLVLEDLTDAERRERSLNNIQMALRVTMVGQYGKHAAARNSGFQKEDVIVEMDGLSSRVSESEWLGHLIQSHKPGDQVPASILRGDTRVTLSMPIQ